jgi:hypothetical protein
MPLVVNPCPNGQAGLFLDQKIKSCLFVGAAFLFPTGEIQCYGWCEVEVLVYYLAPVLLSCWPWLEDWRQIGAEHRPRNKANIRCNGYHKRLPHDAPHDESRIGHYLRRNT